MVAEEQTAPADAASPVRWLERAVAERPMAPALRAVGGTFTYECFARRVAGLTAALRRGGLEPGGGLAVLGGPRWLTALLLHVAPRVGARLIPLDPRLPFPLLRALLRAGGATLVVGGLKGLAPELPALSPEALLAAPEAEFGPAGPEALSAETVHLVLATSGSSGPPKAVPLTCANLSAAVTASRSVLPLGPGDCWLGCLPLFHMGGMAILLRALEAGASVLLHERFEPEAVWSDLVLGSVSHLSLVPAMLPPLLEAGAPPPSLRAVLVGGAALSPALAERAAAWPLWVSYGLTECASQVATCALDAGWEPGSVGRPLPGFELELREAAGVGRIAVRGPAVTGGYASGGRPTGEGIEDGWLVTNDLGRVGPDGTLTVLGRADEVMVTGGEKVHPLQVEAALAHCPGVTEVAVTALPDPHWGAVVAAAYVGGASVDAVEAWARERLHAAWRPRRLLQLESLPRGATGKPDRAALRALFSLRG